MLEVNVERLPSYLIGEERGFERGFKQGAERGAEQSIEQVAKRLFELNFPMAEIAKITGLTIEELQQLSKK